MSKNAFPVLLGILVLVVAAIGCQHDPILITPTPNDGGSNNGGNGSTGDTLAQSGNTCNPDSVYFEKDVLPILATNCALSGCHDAQSHREGIALIDYSRTVSTGGVRAYKPDNSKLYRSLLGGGEDRMPPRPLAPLTTDQIAIIKKWIEQGAQNLTCNADAGGCNTDAVGYTLFIKPLIDSRCLGCHSSASTGGGILLSTYDQVKTTALNGTFYGSVSRANGYSFMPKVGAALSSCELAKVKAWIDAGAKQN